MSEERLQELDFLKHFKIVLWNSKNEVVSSWNVVSTSIRPSLVPGHPRRNIRLYSSDIKLSLVLSDENKSLTEIPERFALLKCSIFKGAASHEIFLLLGISGGGGHEVHTSPPPTTRPAITTVAPTTGCKSMNVLLSICFQHF